MREAWPGALALLVTFLPYYVTTLHVAEQGVKAARGTCERAAAFQATAKKMGVKVTELAQGGDGGGDGAVAAALLPQGADQTGFPSAMLMA